MIRKITPSLNRILVRILDQPPQSKSKIVFTNQKTMKIAEIVQVGSGIRNSDGKLIPCQIKVGQKVLLPVDYSGTMVQVEKNDKQEKFYLFKQTDILGIVDLA